MLKRMKIVHGFRCARLLVGVLAPVLSVSGEARPSSKCFESPGAGTEISGVAFPDCGAGATGGGGPSSRSPTTGEVCPLAPPFAAASRSAFSNCFLSFLRSRLARSFSAFSAEENVPLNFVSLGVSGFEFGNGGVDGLDLPPLR